MRFKITPLRHAISNSVLVYRPAEYSFDVAPPLIGGRASILVNDLSLELDDIGHVVSVWGICPHPTWKTVSLEPPSADFGEILVIMDDPIMKGTSIRLNEQERWPVFADSSSGWVRVTGSGNPASAVKICTGIIFEVDRENHLCAIWLKPDQFPE